MKTYTSTPKAKAWLKNYFANLPRGETARLGREMKISASTLSKLTNIDLPQPAVTAEHLRALLPVLDTRAAKELTAVWLEDSLGEFSQCLKKAKVGGPILPEKTAAALETLALRAQNDTRMQSVLQMLAEGSGTPHPKPTE